MKDSALLLLAAACAAILAWGFWHFLGDDAFGVISTVALVALAADNIRLRRQFRAKEKK